MVAINIGKLLGITVSFLRPLKQNLTGELSSRWETSLLHRINITCEVQGLTSTRKIVMDHEVKVYVKSLALSVQLPDEFIFPHSFYKGLGQISFKY